MKKVIIGVHGLGNKPSKRALKNYWQQSMHEGLQRLDDNLELPLFKMVYWADVFHDQPLTRRLRSPDDPNYLHEPYVKSPAMVDKEDPTLRQKVMDYLNDQINEVFLNQDLSLNYQYITDMILAKYFRELSAYYSEKCMDPNNIECHAKDIIRNRLAKMVRKHEGESILLIGHSMGSIVAFDVLNFLLPDVQLDTFVTLGSPLGLPIVVSKIAAEQKLRNGKTGAMKTPPGIVSQWLNFSDLHDKIAFNYKLGDDFRPNAHGVKPIDSVVFNDYVIGKEQNPHKSFGYLRTREFAKVLRDFIQS